MRISDWSSDVCSSDLQLQRDLLVLISKLKDVETGARGYALTGDESYLATFEAGKKDVVRYLDGLPELTEDDRSEERRVGKACVSTCRSRWSTYHQKKKQKRNRREQNKNSKTTL